MNDDPKEIQNDEREAADIAADRENDRLRRGGFRSRAGEQAVMQHEARQHGGTAHSGCFQ